MLAAPGAAPGDFGQPSMTFIDACNIDSMIGMQSTLGETHLDPQTFFVGEVDVAPSSSGMHPFQSRDDLMLTESAELLSDAPSASLPGSLPDSRVGSWASFPSIPEDAELNIGKQEPFLSSSPLSSIDPYFLALSEATTSPSPSTSSGYPGTTLGLYRSSVPRVTSMPNLQMMPTSFPSGFGSSNDLRRQAASNRSAAMPRSKSANDVSTIKTTTGANGLVEIPHIEYLTPAHLRKGKGGRQPAADPRLDPRIDSKKARRILANRLSAARSKLKQKSAMEALRQRLEMLRVQRDAASNEIESLKEACAEAEAQQGFLKTQLKAAEEHVAIHIAMERKLAELNASSAVTGLLL